jgi:hypothetical protein
VLLILLIGCNNQQETTVNNQKAIPSKCELVKSTKTAANWNITASASAMDNKLTTTAMVGLKQAVVIRCKGADLRKDPSCKSGRLDAYVVTGEMVGSELASVRVKFDDGPPVRQTWSRSDDYNALFSPNPRQFVAQVLKSKELYFEYPPYEKIPTTLNVTVEGLADSLDGSTMNSFLTGLTREKVIKLCGAPKEEGGDLSYSSTSPDTMGIAFSFRDGKLTEVNAIDPPPDEKYKWMWFPDVDSSSRLLVVSSPGLLDGWQLENHKQVAQLGQ